MICASLPAGLNEANRPIGTDLSRGSPKKKPASFPRPVGIQGYSSWERLTEGSFSWLMSLGEQAG